jgi:hypothetical protein
LAKSRKRPSSVRRKGRLTGDGRADRPAMHRACYVAYASNAIEDFSQELSLIIQRFLKLKEWNNTERIVVGGGFRASLIGELVTGRTTLILKSEKLKWNSCPFVIIPMKRAF